MFLYIMLFLTTCGVVLNVGASDYRAAIGWVVAFSCIMYIIFEVKDR